MTSPQLAIILEGTSKEQEKIIFKEFIRQLQLLLRLLNETDRQMSSAGSISTYYRIIKLSQYSPATVEVEALPLDPDHDKSQAVIDSFIDVLSKVEEPGNLKSILSYPFLSDLRSMTMPIGGTISKIKIKSDSRSVLMDDQFRRRVSDLLKPEQTYPGSLSGMLEAINIHGGINIIRIYPDIGPTKVTCRYPRDLEEIVFSGLGKFVNVSGLLKYKAYAKFPHEILVEDIEIFPEDIELPNLYDLQGIAPEATGDLLSEEWVRELRNASA